MTDGETERAAPDPVAPGRAPLLLVDGANVVGSVPDGWWRDRRGAAERLRDRLAGRAGDEELVLVVEGAARGVASVAGVRVVSSPGSGDETVVDLVRSEGKGRDCRVVTADRGLRERVKALGAGVMRPRQLLAEVSPDEP
ncbi:hypothetical protein SAMN06297387_11325 [Streptomyces zhaozhouensis]|uniref:YacP-like NYN domain-containing protein n=1 Tax=Streptomyces zhaozhouensis TaxID=1300267 RepID=A0A286DYX2_9ACTN|nr:NTP pyrophosphohydrolase [Streptomyces zhaozhouensis]SOD63866.1 hypothetical protein SAMN06297387_11325 [Streptomyces zhaozhouensis]